MNKFFWVVLSCLIAFAVHIAYVLFVPALQLQTRIANLAPDDGKGQWRIISDAERFNLLPGFSGSGIAAACPLNVSSGAMDLQLKVPNDYWVLAVYSQSGKQVYALNDKQAGAEEFAIVVSQTKSIIDQIFSSVDQADTVSSIANAAWNVSLPERRGIAVLWIPVGSDGIRKTYAELIEKSTCKRTTEKPKSASG